MAKKKKPLADHALYDISDVTFELRQVRGRREIILVAKAEEDDFNLFKFYLALKDYVDKIEAELGVLEATEGSH